MSIREICNNENLLDSHVDTTNLHDGVVWWVRLRVKWEPLAIPGCKPGNERLR
jgi:hypothetical protein